jgi:competence protein ComEC
VQKHPILLLLLPYLLGISLCQALKIDMSITIILTISVLFAVSFILLKSRSYSKSFHYVNVVLIGALFICFGYQRSYIQAGSGGINTKWLPGDCITARVVSVDPTKSKFTRLTLAAICTEKHSITNMNGNFMAMLQTGNTPLQIDDVIQIKANLTQLERSKNPGDFNPSAYWKSKNVSQQVFANKEYWTKIGRTSHGLDFYFTKWRNWCCSLFEKHLSGQHLAVVQALVFGERAGVSSLTLQSFSDTGAMHVLAVSGLHIGIVLVFLEFLFVKVFRMQSKKKAVIYALAIIWFYCLLTGFSASVARAAVTFSILSIGKLFNKEQSNLNSLAASALLLLLWEPAYLFDIGFQLSYLAMVGIFWFYEPLKMLFTSSNKIIRYAWEGTAVGLAAQLLTVPLSLYYFHQFPNYFALTNIGLMIYSFLILALGLALIVFSSIPVINYLLAKLLFIVMTTMFMILGLIQNLPGSVVYGFEVSVFWVVVFYAAIFMFWLLYERKKLVFRLYFPLTLAVIMLGTMSFQRFNNISKNRIILFASTTSVFSLQSSDEHFCFYDAYRPKNLLKAQMTMKNCAKIYPGKINFLALPYYQENTQVTIGKQKITISRIACGYVLEIGAKRSILLRLNDKPHALINPEIFKQSWVKLNEGQFLNEAVILNY